MKKNIAKLLAALMVLATQAPAPMLAQAAGDALLRWASIDTSGMWVSDSMYLEGVFEGTTNGTHLGLARHVCGSLYFVTSRDMVNWEMRAPAFGFDHGTRVMSMTYADGQLFGITPDGLFVRTNIDSQWQAAAIDAGIGRTPALHGLSYLNGSYWLTAHPTEANPWGWGADATMLFAASPQNLGQQWVQSHMGINAGEGITGLWQGGDGEVWAGTRYRAAGDPENADQWNVTGRGMYSAGTDLYMQRRVQLPGDVRPVHIGNHNGFFRLDYDVPGQDWQDRMYNLMVSRDGHNWTDHSGHLRALGVGQQQVTITPQGGLIAHAGGRNTWLSWNEELERAEFSPFEPLRIARLENNAWRDVLALDLNELTHGNFPGWNQQVSVSTGMMGNTFAVAVNMYSSAGPGINWGAWESRLLPAYNAYHGLAPDTRSAGWQPNNEWGHNHNLYTFTKVFKTDDFVNWTLTEIIEFRPPQPQFGMPAARLQDQYLAGFDMGNRGNSGIRHNSETDVSFSMRQDISLRLVDANGREAGMGESWAEQRITLPGQTAAQRVRFTVAPNRAAGAWANWRLDTGQPPRPDPPRPDDQQTGGGRPPGVHEFEWRVFELTNAERVERGLAPFEWCNGLWLASRAHSNDMAANRMMSHTGSDGSSPWERAINIGGVQATAENVAAGQTTPEQVVRSWMNSDGHRANILSARSFLGVGFADNYWTQKFR